MFVGKRDRHYNRRFLQMCTHLVDPSLHAGVRLGRRGQVRTRSAGARKLLHAAAFQDLRGVERLAARQMRRLFLPIPSSPTDVWEALRRAAAGLVRYRPVRRILRGACFGVRPAWCGSMAANTRSSAPSADRSRSGFAERIVIRQDGRVVSEHPAFARPDPIPGITCRCWQQARRLAQRRAVGWAAAGSGAGANLPAPGRGDRQMVHPDGGAVRRSAGGRGRLARRSSGRHFADVILNILARRRDPPPTAISDAGALGYASRSPIAPDTTTSGNLMEPPVLATDGIAEALRDARRLDGAVKRQHEPPADRRRPFVGPDIAGQARWLSDVAKLPFARDVIDGAPINEGAGISRRELYRAASAAFVLVGGRAPARRIWLSMCIWRARAVLHGRRSGPTGSGGGARRGRRTAGRLSAGRSVPRTAARISRLSTSVIVDEPGLWRMAENVFGDAKDDDGAPRPPHHHCDISSRLWRAPPGNYANVFDRRPFHDYQPLDAGSVL